MVTTYDTWPFLPFHQRSVENNDRWWKTCGMYHVPIDLLLMAPHWTLLVGGPGSGKTVALQTLIREKPAIFTIPYSEKRWPGAAYMLYESDSSHFPQMMATAALALRDYMTQHPTCVEKLTSFELEFLRWLFAEYLGQRAYYRLMRSLPSKLQEQLQEIPETDLFPKKTTPLSVQAQIDELVCLVQAVGFKQVVFLVDLHHPATSNQQQGLADLFGWLELTHHPGFSVVAAVPQELLDDGIVLQRARGRARVIRLEWPVELCQAVAQTHLRQATDKQDLQLSQLADAALLESVEAFLLAEYGRNAPAGWVAFAETLLYLLTTDQPLTSATVKRTFYQRHMLLQIDLDAHGVWRGPQFIRLEDQPLSFISLLYERRGHPINWDDEMLRVIAGSKGNVHSIVARTRKSIEPVPSKPVYIINKRGEGGYWLESYVTL